MKAGVGVFVDTGAWIALALTRDPLHGDAVSAWERLQHAGARLFTSIPVVLETFTFLERNTQREVSLRWKDSLSNLSRLRVLECSNKDLAQAWTFFQRPDLHKLSAVDATSFVLMKREKLRDAFAFDHHFVMVGFKLV